MLKLRPLLPLFLTLAACDPGGAPSQPPADDDPTAAVDETSAALTEDVSIENSSCRRPSQTCSGSKKCCSGSVCLTDDLTPDPGPGQTLTCHACGKTDQVCCGTKRATSFKGLAKRCQSKHTVCPQSESSDICTPCGLLDQPCCIVDGHPSCRDGSTCAHSVAGGHGREAGSGICIN